MNYTTRTEEIIFHKLKHNFKLWSLINDNLFYLEFKENILL